MATYTINNSTITQTTGFTPSGTLAGGDTLIIPSGWTNHLYFLDVVGASGNDIIITNPSTAKISITEVMTSSPWGSITFIRCRYVVVDGSNYSSETYGICSQNGYFGARLYESEDIEIEYAEILDTTYAAMQWQDGTWNATQDVENIKIHNCYVHDIGTEGIYFGNSSFDPALHPSFKDCKIYSNIFENCGWDGIQLGGADEGTNEVYDNYCKNLGTAGATGQTFGIIMGRSSICDIYQNIVINAHNAGIRLGTLTKQCDIHDNVVIDSGTYGISNDSSTAGQTIINNTVVNSDPSIVDYQGIATRAGADLGEIRYNLVVGFVKAGQISTSYSINQDNLTSNSIPAQYFLDVNNDNVRLTSLSPARDAGVGAGYSTTDLDGNTRPYGSTDPDIGAFEYIEAGIPYTRYRGILRKKPQYNTGGGRFR